MTSAWRRYTILTTVGLGLMALAVATMLLAVRELVATGTCASIPVLVSVRPCPDNVGPLIGLASAMPFVGAIGWALYVQRVDRRSPSAWTEGPDWSAWWWPALFLGFGWQFVEVGRAIQAGGDLGSAVAMWVTAAVFAGMGGGPLLFALPVLRRRLLGGTRPAGWTGLVDRLNGALAGAGRQRPVEEPARSVEPDDLIAALERLAALHRAGQLSVAEFAAAKDHVLRRGRGDGR